MLEFGHFFKELIFLNLLKWTLQIKSIPNSFVKSISQEKCLVNYKILISYETGPKPTQWKEFHTLHWIFVYFQKVKK